MALFVAVVGFAVLGDPAVNSGSDAGPKLATAASIAEHGLDGGDLGYWAESADPDGRHRAFVFGFRSSRGWVHATGALMPMLGALGWLAAGSLGALWPSLVSVPLGALGAARLARHLGAPTGATAFWVVGASSPLTFYGLDHWEHAPAMAAAIWAVTLLLERPEGVWVAARVGLIAGLSVVLRRETAVMLGVLGLFTIADADDRRFWLGRPAFAVAGLGAAVGALAAADWLDRRVLGRTLSGKARAQLGEAAGLSVDGGADALRTTISQYTSTDAIYLQLGAATLAGAALAAWGWRDGDRVRAWVGSVLVLGGVAVRCLVAGSGFVPGALAVVPIVAAAPLLASGRARRLVAAALVAMAATLLLQDAGSLAAQWGGRYLLVPAAVLAIAAAAGIEQLRAVRSRERDPLRAVPFVLLGATVWMAALGVWWHVDRTGQLGASRDEVLAIVGDDVVISSHSHFPREIASAVDDRPWLLAADDVEAAVAVAARVAPGTPVWLLEPITCPDGVCDAVPDGAFTTSRLGGDSARFLLTRIDP